MARRNSRKPTYRSRSRKGQLCWQHVTATVIRSQDPLLKGRLRLDRGSGVIEFPTPQQFKRIARQEGVPADEVKRAFGHLMPKRKRRSSRKRRNPTRRWWFG